MKPAISASSLLLLCLGCYLPATKGCIYLYGSRHEAPGGIHYSYGYLGLDWPEKFATCSGNHQSPIYISANTEFQRVKDADASQFNYGKLASTGDNIKILNNGHTVQVGLPADYKPNATVVAKGDPKTTTLIAKFSNASDSDQATRVRITPAQFHFHAHSEHVIDGKDYPLEMHIVNFVYNDTLPGCGATGCATVVGIMLELADDGEEGNPFIDAIFKAMPVNEGESSFLPTDAVLDFDDILPADNSYVTYEGSLTSPPCTEGILWHVLTTPMKITRDQVSTATRHIVYATASSPPCSRCLCCLSTHTGPRLALSRQFANTGYADVSLRQLAPDWR
eukprot:GHRR01003180.1.p1 GENE.GHRR01003180.1~~GHRR01003180.1.p1  ORF type:complete len:336 (+),score=57.13 GHRR01003180.1:219-1226(+)